MYELKTKETENSVIEFIEAIDSVKKREDAYKLVDIFAETTNYSAKMWGPSIIGLELIIINTRQDTRGMHH